MSALAWGIAAVSTALAAVLAAADGAVMSRHTVGSADATRAEPINPGERSHRALAFGRVISLLVAGAAVAFAAGLQRPLEGQPLATAIVASLAIIALVEGAARTFGLTLRDRAWNRLALVARVSEVVLAVPLAIAAAVERRLQQALPEPPDSAVERETSAEQFRQVVAAEAEEYGVSRREAALLRGAFTLGETEVREIMVPRVDIVGVELDTPWSEVVDRARSAEHARIPAYHETLDDIVGILYVKDMLASVIAGEPPAEGWQQLVRPTTFIPTSKRIDDQLREFQATGGHMAVVIDEFGGTAGIVTFEDILEEIVGEIQDEHDVEEPPVESEEGVRFWVAGRVSIDELAELLAIPLDLEGVTTVAGMVYTLLGRVPRAGESFVHHQYRVVVERVRRRRIERVYFERLPDDERAAGDDE